MPHISDSNYHKGATLSLSPPMCLSTRTLLPPDKYLFHYFLSLWEFISTKPKGQGLVNGHWSSGEDSALSLLWPDFNLWLGIEILLQAAVGRGHPRPRSECRSLEGNLSMSHSCLTPCNGSLSPSRQRPVLRPGVHARPSCWPSSSLCPWPPHPAARLSSLPQSLAVLTALLSLCFCDCVSDSRHTVPFAWGALARVSLPPNPDPSFTLSSGFADSSKPSRFPPPGGFHAPPLGSQSTLSL